MKILVPQPSAGGLRFLPVVFLVWVVQARDPKFRLAVLGRRPPACVNFLHELDFLVYVQFIWKGVRRGRILQRLQVLHRSPLGHRRLAHRLNVRDLLIGRNGQQR